MTIELSTHDTPVASSTGRVRVLVAEDHGLMLEAILNRLDSDPAVEVVGAVKDGQMLVDTYAALCDAGRAPDLVLSDYGMPKLNGIEAMRAILDRDPTARVLILTAFDDQSLVVAAMAAGAVGYLLKSVAPGELREKVKMAARGEPVLDARTTAHMIGAVRVRARRPGGAPLQGAPLSGREVEVLPGSWPKGSATRRSPVACTSPARP